VPTPAIDCRGLVVRYGDLVAVDRLSLQADSGRVLALLGPNGAGKTSTMETLEGYRRPATGEVRVLGYDPVSEHSALVEHIGVMLQRGGVYPTMGTRRVLALFSRFYEDPVDVDELLELVGLTSVARTPWRRLSGGEQQRLSLALALVGRPEVLFVDEPTAGVDPEGRIAVRRVIDSERSRGVCVLLTTHELAEAELIADDVVIVSNGRAVARGTPAEIAREAGGDRFRFRSRAAIDVDSLAGALEVDRSALAEHGSGTYVVDAAGTPRRLAALTAWFADRDLEIEELSTGGSLEERYLAVVRSSVEGDRRGAEQEPVDRSCAGDERQPGARADATDTGPSRPAPATSAGSDKTVPGFGLQMRRLLAQARAEVGLTMRRGESLLLTLGIPVVLLVFFSEVHVLPEGTSHPIAFLAPGVLALAVMGTAMVNLSIATGFERGYGVLKRLGSTPLGRPALLCAKIAAVLCVEALQVAVLVPVALGLSWHPTASGVGEAIGVVLLATAGFAGVGLLLAGVLRAEVNLAAANGLWLVLLLVSGMLAPLSKLPGWLAAIAEALPAAALAQGLHASLGLGTSVPTWAWVALVCWAVGAPVAAGLTFRWE
jgi:ABC-2 type transport system ATP-binding protein